MDKKQNWKQKWEQRSTKEKVLWIAQMVLSILIILFALLQIAGIWKEAIKVFEPLMGLLMLIMAFSFWNKKRGYAYYFLGVAIFILFVSILVFFHY